jgi:putative transposase
MSDDRYIIEDQHATHFLTFSVVDWVDIFTRKDYKHIIIDSLNFAVKERGLECFAWVLMSNRMHIVARANPPFGLSDFMRDFKKFTSKKIVATVNEIAESRREWMLHRFEYAAKTTGRAENYKLWQDGGHPIYVEGSTERYRERINYTHQNPVRQLIVEKAGDYLFSSACDYEGRKGLVKVNAAW